MGIVERIKRLRRAERYQPGACHFLHIGKAAGSKIKGLVAQYPQKVIVHSHDVSLRDLPPDASYFFSIRDPVTRFYSGFYSRKRMGRPVHNIPWTPFEAVSFTEFEHANDLAETLFESSTAGANATQAMISIRHTGQNLVSWFFLQGNIFEIRPPIWIVRQEKFDEDFNQFLERANLEPCREMLKSRVHANDYESTPPLSEKAIHNLRRWYAQDVAFYNVCEAWLERQIEGRRMLP
jgi:hypothetical protein